MHSDQKWRTFLRRKTHDKRGVSQFTTITFVSGTPVSMDSLLLALEKLSEVTLKNGKDFRELFESKWLNTKAEDAWYTLPIGEAQI